MGRFCTPANVASFVVYLALLGLVVGGLRHGRQVALRTYGTEAAQNQWDAWREDASQMASSDGPVRRRTPRSSEPPALVLMRDHFGVCLAIGIVLSTVLFATFLLFIRGVWASPSVIDRSSEPAVRRET